jgi:hypothetical protein
MNIKNTIATISMVVILVLVPSLSALEYTATDSTTADCDLAIKGGLLPISFIVANHKDTEITAQFELTSLSRGGSRGSFTVPAKKTIDMGPPAPIGFYIVIAHLSAGGSSLTRIGVVIGMVVIFVTPPFL